MAKLYDTITLNKLLILNNIKPKYNSYIIGISNAYPIEYITLEEFINKYYWYMNYQEVEIEISYDKKPIEKILIKEIEVKKDILYFWIEETLENCQRINIEKEEREDIEVYRINKIKLPNNMIWRNG